MHLDNPQNPYAHILLTTRHLTETGFGEKNRDWNAKSALLQWRRGWADVTNEHLINAGLGVRIDHRSRVLAAGACALSAPAAKLQQSHPANIDPGSALTTNKARFAN
jgi:hypothetical protein